MRHLSSTRPALRSALLQLTRRLAGALAIAMPLLATPPVQASPLSDFIPFGGEGNLAVFDAGSGGWTGSLLQVQPPAAADPLSALTVVLFQLDKVHHTLLGTIALTTTDLLSTLDGSVSGSYVDDDILTNGGQFALDYSFFNGSGLFSGATGFGLAFLDFTPSTSPNNYQENGALVLTVAEPGTLALLALSLLALSAATRRGAAPSQPGGWFIIACAYDG